MKWEKGTDRTGGLAGGEGRGLTAGHTAAATSCCAFAPPPTAAATGADAPVASSGDSDQGTQRGLTVSPPLLMQVVRQLDLVGSCWPEAEEPRPETLLYALFGAWMGGQV